MVWKVLWDYHEKIENLFRRYSKGETQLLKHVLGEIEIYNAVQDEVIIPGVEARDAAWAEAASEAIDRIKDLTADIESLEPGDPAEAKLMKRLEKQWALHTSREKQRLFPILKGPMEDESYVMARQAFTVRQELLAAHGGRPAPNAQLGNYGNVLKGW